MNRQGLCKPDPSVSDLRSARVSVLDAGMASKNADGKLRATARAYRRLEELSRLRRKRFARDGRSGVNVKWTGKILHNLAESIIAIGSEQLNHYSRLDFQHAVYREMKARGTALYPNQIRSGLQIFKDCNCDEDVLEKVSSHRSYGDWWSALSEAEKKSYHHERSQRTRARIQQSTTQEKKARSKSAQEKLKAKYSHHPLAKEDDYDAAVSESLSMKSLQTRTKMGQTFSFEGVSEQMRSSWEAMYARLLLRLKQRFYIYEPMGLPLINPQTKRLEVYHPDFLEYRNHPDARTTARFIEIKGRLTAFSQRKIALFRKCYLEDDLSVLPRELHEKARALISDAKAIFRQQFGVQIGPDTPLKVFGELPWSDSIENFQDTERFGMIPRIRKLLGEAGNLRGVENLSRREFDRLSKEVSKGKDRGQYLRPGLAYCLDALSTDVAEAGPHSRGFVLRSSEFHINYMTALNVFVDTQILDRAFRSLNLFGSERNRVGNQYLVQDTPQSRLAIYYLYHVYVGMLALPNGVAQSLFSEIHEQMATLQKQKFSTYEGLSLKDYFLAYELAVNAFFQDQSFHRTSQVLEDDFEGKQEMFDHMTYFHWNLDTYSKHLTQVMSRRSSCNQIAAVAKGLLEDFMAFRKRTNDIDFTDPEYVDKQLLSQEHVNFLEIKPRRDMPSVAEILQISPDSIRKAVLQSLNR